MKPTPFSGNELYKDLIDIQQPDPVAWWPQTIGWKIVAAALLIYLAHRLFLLGRHYWQNRYRKEALTALKNIDLSDGYDASRALFFIIKTVAAYLSSKLGSATGKELLHALDQLLPGQKEQFQSELGERWLDGLFRPREQFDLSAEELQQLIQWSENWLRNHQLPQPGEQTVIKGGRDA